MASSADATVKAEGPEALVEAFDLVAEALRDHPLSSGERALLDLCRRCVEPLREVAALTSTAGAGAGDLPTDLQEAIQRLDAIREEEHRSLKDGGGIRLYRIAPAQSRAEELSLEYIRSLLSAVPASSRIGAGERAQGTDQTEPHDPLKAAVWQALLPFMGELAQTGGVTFMGLRNAVVAAVRPLADVAALSQGGGAGRSEKGEGEPLERVRHVKRGTEYEVLGEAEAQVAVSKGWRHFPGGIDLGDAIPAALIHDGCKLTVYRCLKTGKLWCRFTDEFRDGRFVPPAPAQSPSTSDREG